ncbi:kinase-like domain-containing protein [Amanita rubescens]|nr:kinase-like domain-containing protein [Amanita rubescens]
MGKLSEKDILPKSLFITDVKTDSTFRIIGMGGFGNVSTGSREGQHVALKVIYKTSHQEVSELLSVFCREALAWRSLSHKFILPLLGIYEEEGWLFLVSPLMVHGTLSEWRRNQESDITEIHRLIQEVAEGVQYIHSEGIVHGDLHPGNILLDDNFHCQITDFGLTRHSEATVARSTTTHLSYFAAPELFGTCAHCGRAECAGCFVGSEQPHRSKTMKTDIYAFGCLYYAIFFDTVPFEGKTDYQITRLVTAGKRPDRLANPGMDEDTWNLIQSCWKHLPLERPTMEEIVRMLPRPA